jgi:hypothetical protein
MELRAKSELPGPTNRMGPGQSPTGACYFSHRHSGASRTNRPHYAYFNDLVSQLSDNSRSCPRDLPSDQDQHRPIE